jgi:hypothetical protein
MNDWKVNGHYPAYTGLSCNWPGSTIAPFVGRFNYTAFCLLENLTGTLMWRDAITTTSIGLAMVVFDSGIRMDQFGRRSWPQQRYRTSL